MDLQYLKQENEWYDQYKDNGASGIVCFSCAPRSGDIFLILGREYYPYKFWCGFTGTKQINESLEDCAAREFLEESLSVIPIGIPKCFNSMEEIKHNLSENLKQKKHTLKIEIKMQTAQPSTPPSSIERLVVVQGDCIVTSNATINSSPDNPNSTSIADENILVSSDIKIKTNANANVNIEEKQNANGNGNINGNTNGNQNMNLNGNANVNNNSSNNERKFVTFLKQVEWCPKSCSQFNKFRNQLQLIKNLSSKICDRIQKEKYHFSEAKWFHYDNSDKDTEKEKEKELKYVHVGKIPKEPNVDDKISELEFEYDLKSKKTFLNSFEMTGKKKEKFKQEQDYKRLKRENCISGLFLWLTKSQWKELCEIQNWKLKEIDMEDYEKYKIYFVSSIKEDSTMWKVSLIFKNSKEKKFQVKLSGSLPSDVTRYLYDFGLLMKSYCSIPDNLRQHPALFVNEWNIPDVKTVYLEKDSIRYWSLDRLKEVLELGGTYNQDVFKPCFLPCLAKIVSFLENKKNALILSNEFKESPHTRYSFSPKPILVEFNLNRKFPITTFQSNSNTKSNQNPVPKSLQHYSIKRKMLNKTMYQKYLKEENENEDHQNNASKDEYQ